MRQPCINAFVFSYGIGCLIAWRSERSDERIL